jgi:hypothetical protein
MLARVSSSPILARQSLRARVCALSLVALLALASALAPGAIAAGFENGKALNELNEAAGSSEPATTPTTPKTTEAKNSRSVILLATAGAIVLLCVIAFVIARDARRVAPAGAGDGGEPRPAKDARVTLQKRRAKAKAARKQRKRTR